VSRQLEHRRYPCQQCPWRKDADLADFTDADFIKLGAANGRPGAEASLDGPMMSCHLDQPGTAHAMRLCGGWLATVGHDHLAVRFHVLTGKLPADVLAPGEDWPALYADLDEMLAHRPPHRSRRRAPDEQTASQPASPPACRTSAGVHDDGTNVEEG
jgi:hypothetical protein